MHKSEGGGQNNQVSWKVVQDGPAAAAMVEIILLGIQYFGPWYVKGPFTLQQVLRVV